MPSSSDWMDVVSWRKLSSNAVLTAGMLCTLSWAREKGFESPEVPVHVYGPLGLAEYIR